MIELQGATGEVVFLQFLSPQGQHHHQSFNVFFSQHKKSVGVVCLDSFKELGIVKKGFN